MATLRMMIDLNSLTLPQLFDELTKDGCLERLIDAAFKEDLGEAGDITTASLRDSDRRIEANLVARQSGVLAGLAVIDHICPNTSWTATSHDGEFCDKDQSVGKLTGKRHDILGIERIILNLLGRLSGVATLTRQYVDAIQGMSAVICDTRKTTPGLRNLEKYAVHCGGGTLHRLGLFDAALFKDNHLAGIPLNDLSAKLEMAIRKLKENHDVRLRRIEHHDSSKSKSIWWNSFMRC